MISNLRKLVIVGGVTAAIVIGLLAIAAITSLWIFALLAVILGFGLTLAVCMCILRIAVRSSTLTRKISTRTNNLEIRGRNFSERMRAREDEGSRLSARISKLEDTAVQHALSFKDIHDFEKTTVENMSQASQKLLERFSDIEKNFSDIRSSLLFAQKACAFADLKQSKTAEIVERNSADIRVLQKRFISEIEKEVVSDLQELKHSYRELLRSTFETSLLLSQEPLNVISSRAAKRLLEDYLASGDVIRISPLLGHPSLLDDLRLTDLRKIYRGLRTAGYWEAAATVLRVVAGKSRGENDTRAIAKVEHEIRAYSCDLSDLPGLPDGNGHDQRGPILHVVGRVLPETQTGYTLRTQYTAMSQAIKGLPVAIVGQPGITGRELNKTEQYTHQGIDYYLLPGPPRKDALLDDWLSLAIEQLADLVLKVRPSILHAQSDFFNALIAQAVGKKYGIPTVYESRGFWEESWLSRTITAQGWGTKANELFEKYGLPDAYVLRKRAEKIVRERADHVFTLAEVMQEHIIQASAGAIENSAVSMVPNAVDPSSFPVQAIDHELKSRLGLPADAVVVGYISSIVEYEGIDTLLDGYQIARSVSETPICMLLVGDGDYLPTLKEYAAQRGIKEVFFTGRVPHSEVLRYYGLIDIFVVPRKPSAVADLVTPLKPFEAFSTGRAVILSDVGALREIARQSQSVETFNAGDAESLARKIQELASEPQRRSELSSRAAAWVRNHRTWGSNVGAYYEVYRQLGYAGPSSPHLEAELRLRNRGINPGDVLDAIADDVCAPLASWFSMGDLEQDPVEILERGWIYAEFEPIPMKGTIDWCRYGTMNRSWGFHLHAFEFMDPLLQEYSASGERIWLDAAVNIALDWVSIYLGPTPPEDPMAWYDMSLALRTPRLLSLLNRVSRNEDLKPQGTIILDAVLRHTDELLKNEAFNPRNNHGFYTAASQLHLALFGSAIPGIEQTAEAGSDRMNVMAERQFAADGVHLEHSPGYHQMLLGSFEAAIRDGLIQSEEILERIRRAAHVLGWMIQPDGHLVQFGDTQEISVRCNAATSLDPETQFLLSGGKSGVAPASELAVFSEGGYAFVRSPAPQTSAEITSAGYLAFSAAFHSRVHKHADDLNLVWFDRGSEILVDSGRWGYGDLLPADSSQRAQGFYYGSMERQYVEGTMAHNTLMMDGADQLRRGRDPYGSGILEATQTAEAFDISARVNHTDYIHRRRVVYRPGNELRVIDSVFSQDTDAREATIWFNIDGGFELIESGEALVFERLSGDKRLRLEIVGPGTRLEPVRGSKDPLRGWRSRLDRTMEPVWSVGYRVEVKTRMSASTVFRLS